MSVFVREEGLNSAGIHSCMNEFERMIYLRLSPPSTLASSQPCVQPCARILVLYKHITEVKMGNMIGIVSMVNIIGQNKNLQRPPLNIYRPSQAHVHRTSASILDTMHIDELPLTFQALPTSTPVLNRPRNHITSVPRMVPGGGVQWNGKP